MSYSRSLACGCASIFAHANALLLRNVNPKRKTKKTNDLRTEARLYKAIVLNQYALHRAATLSNVTTQSAHQASVQIFHSKQCEVAQVPAAHKPR
jgi:hypothetical protein